MIILNIYVIAYEVFSTRYQYNSLKIISKQQMDTT